MVVPSSSGYVNYREEKHLIGERRGKPVHKRKFFLVDSEGQEQLVATGEDTGAGDGHYIYRGSHPNSNPVSCTSRRKLNSWLQTIIAGVPSQLGIAHPGAAQATSPAAAPEQHDLDQLQSPPEQPLSPDNLPAQQANQVELTGPHTAAPQQTVSTAPSGAAADLAAHSAPSLGYLASLPHLDMAQPMFWTYRRERFRAEDGLRRINYYLKHHNGHEQVAVNAKEIKSSGGHYAYHAAPDFGPRVWKNGGDVRRWLASLCTHPDPLLTPSGPGKNANISAASTWNAEGVGGAAASAVQHMQTGGLIRDPERRRSLVDSTVAAIEAKLDMLRRRAGMESTLTLVGLDSDVRIVATAGVAGAARPVRGAQDAQDSAATQTVAVPEAVPAAGNLGDQAAPFQSAPASAPPQPASTQALPAQLTPLGGLTNALAEVVGSVPAEPNMPKAEADTSRPPSAARA